MGLIKHAWLESGGVYGYRKVYQEFVRLAKPVVSTEWPAWCAENGYALSLALFIDGHRPILASGRWLVDEATHDHRIGTECSVIGSLESKTTRSCDGAFGSR